MSRHAHTCALKHEEDYRSNVDFVHKIDLFRGVTALKKAVTCETVLNLQREKNEILEKAVGEEKHLVMATEQRPAKEFSFISSMKLLDDTGQDTK